MKIGTRTRGGWVLKYIAHASVGAASRTEVRSRKTEHARRQSNPGMLVTPAGARPYRCAGIEIKDRGEVRV